MYDGHVLQQFQQKKPATLTTLNTKLLFLQNAATNEKPMSEKLEATSRRSPLTSSD